MNSSRSHREMLLAEEPIDQVSHKTYQDLEKNKILSLSIYKAAKRGDLEQINQLLNTIKTLSTDDLKMILNWQHGDEDDFENQNLKGTTVLFEAVKYGHLEIVNLLLSTAKKIDEVERDFTRNLINLPVKENSVPSTHEEIVTYSSIHAAIIMYEFANKDEKPRRFEIIQILFKYGADFSQPNSNNETPLYFTHDTIFKPFLNPYASKLRLTEKEGFWSDDFLCPMEGQQWLYLFMDVLGYKDPDVLPDGSSIGLCNGIANAAAESLLIKNGFKEFNRRLKEIYCITLKAEYDVWEKIYRKDENIYKNFDEEKLGRTFKTKAKENINKILEKINKKQKPNDAVLLGKVDHIVFCDKIQTYQRTGEITNIEFFTEEAQEILREQMMENSIDSQNNRLASEAVESLELSAQGGRRRVLQFLGVYNCAELTNLFESLERIFKLDTFPHPISINLIVPGHNITVGYDEEKSRWILINPNEMHYIPNASHLAEKIFSQHGENKLIASYGNMCTATNNVEKITPFINQLKNAEQWKTVHTINKEKARRKKIYSRGERVFSYSWEKMAIFCGEAEIAKECAKLERENFFLRHWKSLAIGFGIGLVMAGILVAFGFLTVGIGPAILGLAVLPSVILPSTIAIKKIHEDNQQLKEIEKKIEKEIEAQIIENNKKFIPFADEQNNINNSISRSSTLVLNKIMLTSEKVPDQSISKEIGVISSGQTTPFSQEERYQIIVKDSANSSPVIGITGGDLNLSMDPHHVRHINLPS